MIVTSLSPWSARKPRLGYDADHNVLYATEPSSVSEPAWEEAKRLGRLFRVEILLLHVVAPSALLPVEGYFPARAYQELLERARRDAEVGLDRAPALSAWA
jgi:nucleotide-binding universal stress UspA family protein